MSMVVDESRLEELMGQLVGHMTGAAVCSAIWIGDEVGFYRSLARNGSMSAEELAADTGCNPRLTREWLDGQTAAGLISYDTSTDIYTLGAEAQMALADETSPAFVARAMNAIGAFTNDVPKVVEAFKADGALSWGDHHPCLFKGTEWFFRTGYRAHLTTEWIPALEGVEEKLQAGAKVADIGCGHGASAVVLANAYPKSQITGIDFHSPSIEHARAEAAREGLSNVTFEVGGAKDYTGSYDLICFFDCLHDMGDPVGVARHALGALNPGGTVLLVEPYAMADRTENLYSNPMAALLYTASTIICTPNSLSQEVGLGLGAQAGESKLREVFIEAGFTSFRKAHETPLNLILEARA